MDIAKMADQTNLNIIYEQNSRMKLNIDKWSAST
jgi:hypothetical protein